MHPNNSRARRAFRKRWDAEDRTATLVVRVPLPGTRTDNPLYGPSSSGGVRETTLANGLGGWFTDRFTSDGYRIVDDQDGRLVFLASEYTVPDADGDDTPLTADSLRALTGSSGATFLFNDEPVKVTAVEWDHYAGAVVVDIRKVP